jgi:hypothetical protein
MTFRSATVMAGVAALALLAGPAMADESSGKMKSDLNMNNNGNAAGASTGEQGKTSDRTPGNKSPERAPGSSVSGGPGTDAGQTTGGTSDRTPNNPPKGN